MNRKSFRINNNFKRFILSFLIVLCLPIICFSFVFFRNYRDVYRQKIMQQAISAIQNTGKELDRHIDSLSIIAFQDNQNHEMRKILDDMDYYASEMKQNLISKVVTQSVLDNIYYFNLKSPDTIYSPQGTCSTLLFANNHLGIADTDSFTKRILEIQYADWLHVNKFDSLPEYLFYIVRAGNHGYWFFSLSTQQLSEIFRADNSYTILLDNDGVELFSNSDSTIQKGYNLTYDSSGGYFHITRIIDEGSLFAELNALQRYFLLAVIVVLLAGGLLTLALTYYNETPIRKLLVFSKEKVKDIPKDMDGLEAFQFAMKSMEEQVSLSESKQRINSLLLHLIYGEDCDTEAFREDIKDTGLFRNAECYRVILITTTAENAEIIRRRIELYLNLNAQNEYEFRLIDMPKKDKIVIIAGMTEQADTNYKYELMQIQQIIETNTNEKISFYIGEKYSKLQGVHWSYSQALSCYHNRSEEDNEQIICYDNTKKKEFNNQYPKETLDALYQTLLAAETDQAMLLTDQLIETLKTLSDNPFAYITLYYDILNTYYRVQAKLEIDMDLEFLETDLLKSGDNFDAAEVLGFIKEQYLKYIEKNNIKPIDQDNDLSEKEKKDDLIPRVIAYINENKNSGDLSASLVADHFGMSISHMSHKFKTSMNQTISDYITEKKFTYARELLSETEYSIKEISYRIGYSNPVNFTYRFKQLYGITPIEYRLKNKQLQ